ncbi:Gfo/Idh/MocA family oxidoreductase [bacterium]|nr:Gfo/Idh/MocA family oxidoreductase [bacterium]MDB4820571.1 Gfo/Idh/MocA family oxidoreductase [Akkermansiaceae bacterium]MDC0265084.1 Gfo/Idh/MocA family oxidoreductase [bacterium]
MDRRRFFYLGAAGSAASLTSGYRSDFSDLNPRVGLIGAGWYGKTDLMRLLEVAPVNVVGIADVDSKMAEGAAEIVSQRQVSKKKPRTFRDYRKMLASEKFDIILVGTPDHWHALPMIDAVKAGADVFVQKPTGCDVVESQAMLAAARKYKKVVQVGTQRRSTPHLIEAKEKVIDEGLLGEIAHVEICCYYHMRSRANPQEAVAEVPENLDYDLWTGPAPMRPYNSVVHPKGWRSFMEYGNGIVGDMCVHMLDTTRWLLDLGWPESVSSDGGILVDAESIANISDTQTATFDFGKLQVVWQHRSWGAAPDKGYPWSLIIYGTKGTLKADVHRYEFIPQGKGEAIKKEALNESDKFPHDISDPNVGTNIGPAIRRHMQDFLTQIQSRGRPVADIEEGHISSASSILANHAMDLDRTLHWDIEKGEVKDDAEANALLARKYREGYTHPDPATV